MPFLLKRHYIGFSENPIIYSCMQSSSVSMFFFLRNLRWFWHILYRFGITYSHTVSLFQNIFFPIEIVVNSLFGPELVFTPQFLLIFLIKILPVWYGINWPSLITRLTYFASYSVKPISYFMIQRISWYHEI